MYPETSFECQKSQGTSSAAFLTGDQWGSWDGRLVVGIMGIGFGGTPVGQRIDVIRLSEDGKSAEEVEYFKIGFTCGARSKLVQLSGYTSLVQEMNRQLREYPCAAMTPVLRPVCALYETHVSTVGAAAT